mmetsp:Transcript_18527/g.40112  ORF Transcript_18527/g.40112 Transcript_18527/m.40112 type:complete len:80 (-) Transcript_18527:588-827(-)
MERSLASVALEIGIGSMVEVELDKIKVSAGWTHTRLVKGRDVTAASIGKGVDVRAVFKKLASDKNLTVEPVNVRYCQLG